MEINLNDRQKQAINQLRAAVQTAQRAFDLYLAGVLSAEDVEGKAVNIDVDAGVIRVAEEKPKG